MAKVEFDKSIHITKLTETYSPSDGMGKMWDPYTRNGGVVTYNELLLPPLNRTGLQRGGQSSTHWPDGTPKPKPSGGGSSTVHIRDDKSVTTVLEPEYYLYAPGLLIADSNLDFKKEDYLRLLKNRRIVKSELQYAQMRIKNNGFAEGDLKKLTLALYYVARKYVNHISKWVHLKTVKGGDYSNVNSSCKMGDYTYGEENFVLDLPEHEPLILIAHINNIEGNLDPLPTGTVDADELNKSPYWNFLI